MLRDDSLVNKRVLVTAGASGIGLAIARGFLEAGAQVMVCDIDDVALETMRTSTSSAYAVRCDVSNESDIRSLYGHVDRELGGLDVLINNAGIAGPTAPIEELSKEDLERTLQVNVVGTALCTKYAVPRLRQGHKASILNMSSVAGHLGMPARTPYCASKWGVIGLTKTWAIELGKAGIRVNAVLPGSIEGDRVRRVMAARAQLLGKTVEELTVESLKRSSLGRFIPPEEVANMVLFVSSDLAANISGQTIAVDGHMQFLG